MAAGNLIDQRQYRVESSLANFWNRCLCEGFSLTATTQEYLIDYKTSY